MIGITNLNTNSSGRVLFFSGGEIFNPAPFFELEEPYEMANFASSMTILEDTANQIIVINDDQGNSEERLSRVYIYSTKNTTNIFSKNFQITPELFELYPNYPNPFNSSTKIRFRVHLTSSIKLTVYDIYGRKVKVLGDEIKQRGTYTIIFNAEQYDLSSGIYFLKMEAKIKSSYKENFQKTMKMVYLK